VVSLQRQGFELKGIYTIEDDGSFSDTYSSGDAFSLKKGSYIIALYAREKDDQITFTYHDSYVTGNGKNNTGSEDNSGIYAMTERASSMNLSQRRPESTDLRWTAEIIQYTPESMLMGFWKRHTHGTADNSL